MSRPVNASPASTPAGTSSVGGTPSSAPAAATDLQYAVSLLRQKERAISRTIAAYQGDREATEYWQHKLDSVQAAIHLLDNAVDLAEVAQ